MKHAGSNGRSTETRHSSVVGSFPANAPREIASGRQESGGSKAEDFRSGRGRMACTAAACRLPPASGCPCVDCIWRSTQRNSSTGPRPHGTGDEHDRASAPPPETAHRSMHTGTDEQSPAGQRWPTRVRRRRVDAVDHDDAAGFDPRSPARLRRRAAMHHEERRAQVLDHLVSDVVLHPV